MKRILYLPACFVLLLFILVACRGGHYQSLSADEFGNLLQRENVQLIDVRTDVEFSENHIPGAVNLNVMDVSFKEMADTMLQKNKPVAVYCRSGKRSKKAAVILSGAGYTVYDLDKGFNDWESAGKKTAQ